MVISRIVKFFVFTATAVQNVRSTGLRHVSIRKSYFHCYFFSRALAYLFVDICFLAVIAKRLNDSLRTVRYEMQPRAYTLQPNTKTKMTGDSFKNML